MPDSTESPAILRRLLQLASDFLQAPDFETVLELVGQAIPELLHSDGGLLLVNANGREFVTEFERRRRTVRDAQESELLPHARRALRDSTPLLLPEVAPRSGLPPPALKAHDLVSLIALPFPPVKPLGALVSVWFRKGCRDELAQLVPILRLVGELTGAAMGNADIRRSLACTIEEKTRQMAHSAHLHALELSRRDAIEKEIHRLSITDMMTGLLNRRGFFLNAERSIKLARRQRVSSALLFIDIDGLKGVNDALGHDVGDELIRDVASILKTAFRDADVVARIGGDEFAVLTVDTSAPETLRARLQQSLADFTSHQNGHYQICFSTGIIECDPAADVDVAAYVKQADELMYQRKRLIRAET